MTGTRHCPSCGEALKARAKECECGWTVTSAPSPAAAKAAGYAASGFDRDRFRCTWMADGKQCRYPGSCTRGTLGSGTLYCFGHLACSETGDAELGKTLVAKSEDEVTIPDGDYSADGMLANGRVAHRKKVEKATPMPRVPGVRYARTGGDRQLKRIAAIGAEAFPGADDPVDRERIAEREAIAFEGQS
jgi:hypothetical protein